MTQPREYIPFPDTTPRSWRDRLGRLRFGSALAAALFGALLGLLFLPFSLAFLAPLPLAWLFRAVSREAPRGAFRAAFWFGAGFFAAHLWWLPISFAPLFGPLGAALFAPLVGLLALMWGAAAAGTRWLAGRYALWALPFAWVLLEYARGLGPLAFPWGLIGYAFANTPLVQVADLGGLPLVSLLVGLCASALAAPGAAHAPRAAIAALLALALAHAARVPAPPMPNSRALLVQGSVDPRQKAAARSADELALYVGLTRAGLARGGADLAVWPETAAPVAPTDPGVARLLRSLGAPLLLGAPSWDAGGYRNSAYAFDGRVTGRQDKLRLVPFGEYFPLRAPLAFAYEPLLAALGVPGLTGARPGTRLAPLPLGRIRAGTLICYESTFPALSRALVRKGANVLVVISNDAWFGRGAGAEQHFQMGRVRAIETRRFLARAGNDGITAVIDSRGKVVARFPRAMRGALSANFGLSTVTTPYVRFGDWPVMLSALVLAGLTLANRRGGR